MKKINSFTYSFFCSPKRDYGKIKFNISFLKKEMKEIKFMPNKLRAIVRLFQVISIVENDAIFSDFLEKLKKKNYGQLDVQIKIINQLNEQFSRGRVIGYNRSKNGEKVSVDNVYLPHFFSNQSHPVSFWLDKELELKKSIRPDFSKDMENLVTEWELINSCQAGSFVQSNVEEILKNLILLEKSF